MNGFKGGLNMQNLMRQAQKMQQDLAVKQEEFDKREVSASVAGGMVEITMTGDRKIKKISIKKEAVDPNDIEMLEDLLVAGFNDCNAKLDELKQSIMGNMPIGM